MSKYLNPTGRGTFAIAICDRCREKHFYGDLKPDRDKPGLRVCTPCNDLKDPWKLPPRQTENISVQYPRPDTSIATDGSTVE